jgi:uncharacterized surface protein with fasciclin (FAS1) repeats
MDHRNILHLFVICRPALPRKTPRKTKLIKCIFYFICYEFRSLIVISLNRKVLSSVFLAAAMSFSAVAAKAADIVDTAIAAGQFNTLVAAVQAAGLVDTLKSEGPFTVFAPTDDAFAKLPAGTVESLLLPENRDTLVAILTYHVVPGKIMSADIAGAVTEVASVQGGMLAVNATDGVKINDATVIIADIETDNGVIHVIDTVILPQ